MLARHTCSEPMGACLLYELFNSVWREIDKPCYAALLGNRFHDSLSGVLCRKPLREHLTSCYYHIPRRVTWSSLLHALPPAGAMKREVRMTMKIGFVIVMGENPETGRAPSCARLRNLTPQAEDAGFDSVWFWDHLMYRQLDQPQHVPSIPTSTTPRDCDGAPQTRATGCHTSCSVRFRARQWG